MKGSEQAFKILIVDDDPDVRESLSNILKRRGYFVLTAQSGMEGSILAVANKVDIIICDIFMPNMNGIEFLKKIHEINLNTEVIIVTGNPSIEACVESYEKNAIDYLTKPLTIEKIMDSLQKAEKRIHEKSATHH